jgi:hypothetical protein
MNFFEIRPLWGAKAKSRLVNLNGFFDYKPIHYFFTIACG